MKVLVLIGVPRGSMNYKRDQRPLAYVRMGVAFGRPQVTPAHAELQAFATEVQRRLDDRINNHADTAFVYAAPSEERPHARKIVSAKDPNLLEAIHLDDNLWGLGKYIGDYQVLPMYSQIVDQ